MTDDELRAAAERLRNATRTTFTPTTQHSRPVLNQEYRDLLTIRDAYLAEHDPTPLTLDILRAELGEPIAYGKEGMLWQRPGYFVASSASAETIVANGDPESPDTGGSLMAIVTTLGQLRRILSVVQEQEDAK